MELMDLQSLMGYGYNSPFNAAPYLDITTPEGLITMENTPIDLMGIDNLGNVKKMKAGRKKQYKFPGNVVREIPMGYHQMPDGSIMANSTMNNPYQKGGLTSKQMFDFLFDDDEEVIGVTKPDAVPPAGTAPSTEEVDMADQTRRFQDEQNDALAMSIMMDEGFQRGNPYGVSAPRVQTQLSGNPYAGEIKSSGKFGNQNVGPYGRQIYGQLSADLGYTPVVNSIYRSKAQNDALIAAGKPASKTSYHLTGNAVDLKPADWHRLSNEQQQYYRQNYDVIYHDNHYHIEPK